MPKRERGQRNPAGQRRAANSDLYVVVPSPSKSTSRKDNNDSTCCDDEILLPVQSQVLRILTRLQDTGYSTIALTHTIYGRPSENDQACVALPESLWTARPHGSDKNSAVIRLKILRRLHVVVENVSDVGLYSGASSPIQTLLDGYDLISVAPRNDAVFSAVCSSASSSSGSKSTRISNKRRSNSSSSKIDIITLEYNCPHYLPFKLRGMDIRAAVEQGRVALELPYGAALLNPKLRRSLIQTAQELQTVTAGMKTAMILFSSGPRQGDRINDVGPLAFRMPADLRNLLQTVLGFAPSVSSQAVDGTDALEMARRRRSGEGFKLSSTK
jgi:RNase P subunit p30